MSWIDYLVVAIPFVAIVWVGVRAKSYVTGVSDFLSAGRCAGRYLIGVASGEAMLGMITVISYCEMYYKSGWSFFYWQNLLYAAIWIMAITGFVNYRYRETRVLTMAQLLEKRYSRKFRIFTGMISFLAGLLNYALFPAIAGRFLIYYCQLPDAIVIGSLHISMFGFLMAFCLLVALLIALSGGQLTTMVTDCMQGIFTYFVFTVLLIVVMLNFSGAQFEYALGATRGAGESLLNPFDISNLTDFNMMFVFIGVFTAIYSRMAWQGTQGYNCAGASPHEQKMGGLISSWRYSFTPLMTIVLVLGAYTFMHHPDFAGQAAGVQAELASRINESSATVTATLRNQMLVPVTLRTMLPVGMVGAFAAVMVFMMLSTDTTYLHSWGSIFIQDVVMPFRRKPFAAKTQLLLLRLSIVFVAVFAWTFSMYFGQVSYIAMFFAITGAIYLAGAGAVIIGGLYWRRGTTAGAWTAMITGALFSVAGFTVQTNWGKWYPHLPDWVIGSVGTLVDFLNGHLSALGRWEMSPSKFPITGQEMSMLGMALSIIGYIVVSLLTCRGDFDLDRLLNRGKYNLEHTGDAGNATAKAAKWWSWRRITGITDEYSRGDRIVSNLAVGWTFYGLAVFGVIAVWNLGFRRWPVEWWFNLWRYYTVPLALLVGVVTAVWFTWGGSRDLIRMFRALRKLKRSPDDSGWVDESGEDRE
ncbi:MAG: hypothetical protein PHI85_07650 [Victivallaceae bacterium]|nr:hypothetical protein [Victivallaceae bacterium]